MPKIPQAVLKAVFKRGKKLYRVGSSAWQESRFRSGLQREVDGDIMSRTGEALGSYYAKRPKDIGPLIAPGSSTRDLKIGSKDLIRAVLVKGARYKSFGTSEWKDLVREIPDSRQLTSYLKKEYDLIEVPDIAGMQPHIRQVVQLNPRKVIRKTREVTKKGLIRDRYKLFGITSLVGSLAEMKRQAYENVFDKGQSQVYPR